ncbi:MAG: histidinol-phosphate transaminase [Thermodesulfobacteriota bacterium]
MGEVAIVRSEKKTGESNVELIKDRVRRGVRELQAYSVPHIDCRVRLDGNESPFTLPEEVLREVVSAASKIPYNRYPDPDAGSLRRQISKMVGFPPEGIVLGNGSDELIEMLLIAFSGGTGGVLIPVPTFSMYGIMARALELELIEVELDGDFDIDIDKTVETIESKDPDLIFLASPNNPTGNCFSKEKILKILDVSSGMVVVDEAYFDFSGLSVLPLLEKYPNLIVLRTMSKIGFASLRLGIALSGPELASELDKVRLPYNINSFTQACAEVVQKNPGFIAQNIQLIVRERDRLLRALGSMEGVEAFPSDANFVLIRVEDADGVWGGLVERGVLVRNFNSPGRLRNCLRVTAGAPEENDAFLAALKGVLSP